MSLLHLVIITLVTSDIATGVALDTKRSRREIHKLNKFVNVDNSCEPGVLHISVTTTEPFTGAVYTRGYPSKRCLVHGDGKTLTNLTLPAQSCGVKVTESSVSGDHNIYEVQVYIQFDRWVQQVIDEQVQIRCKLKHPATHLNLQKLNKHEMAQEAAEPLQDKTDSNSDKSVNLYNSSLIIHGPINPTKKEPNLKPEDSSNTTLTSRDVNSSPESFSSVTANHKDSSPGNIVSEIKISTAPNSDETQAMVSSTLLTVSSRVKERLQKKENTLLKLAEKMDKVSNQTHRGQNAGSNNTSTTTLLSGKVDRDVKEQNLNALVETWKPFSNLADSHIWRITAPGDSENEPVSVWMDIIKGDQYKGAKTSEGLLVGEEATLAVSCRARPGLQTKVTSCNAHDGAGGALQDLTDARGCPVDASIMPELRMTVEGDVEISYASFRAFKFPDKGSLHLRCTVLICLGRCPESRCDVIVSPRSNRGTRRGRVVDPSLVVGVGEYEPTDILSKETIGVRSPILQTLKPGSTKLNAKTSSENSQLSENKEARPRLLVSNINDSSTAGLTSGMVVDRVEVFNSVEVRAPGVESPPKDLVKQYRKGPEDWNGEDELEEELGSQMFCIASQKLVVAFGLLLFVLMAALLFAAYTCARHKLFSIHKCPNKSLKVFHIDRASVGTPPPPILSPSCLTKRDPRQIHSIIAPGNYYRFHR